MAITGMYTGARWQRTTLQMHGVVCLVLASLMSGALRAATAGLLYGTPTALHYAPWMAVVAAIVSTVGARSRREALSARKAAKEAEALHSLAYAVTHRESQAVLLSRAVAAISVIFDAPAVILEDRGGALVQVDRGAPLSAAGQALVDAIRTRASALKLLPRPTSPRRGAPH